MFKKFSGGLMTQFLFISEKRKKIMKKSVNIDIMLRDYFAKEKVNILIARSNQKEER